MTRNDAQPASVLRLARTTSEKPRRADTMDIPDLTASPPVCTHDLVSECRCALTLSRKLLANGEVVGYVSCMSGSRARRWIAMYGFLVAGCRSDAAVPRAPVAPVAE